RALLLHDRHRHLGQIVEREIIDRAAAHLFDRGLERVTPKTLAVCDSDWSCHVSPFRAEASAPAAEVLAPRLRIEIPRAREFHRKTVCSANGRIYKARSPCVPRARMCFRPRL